MKSEFKVVQIPEGDYLRLVKEAQENAEKDFPLTMDELYTIGMALACYYPRDPESPLLEKVRGMFDRALERERRG